MGGRGQGASNMGDIRPRAKCGYCGRSTAVTFNARTGEAYLRSHNDRRNGENKRCAFSGRVAPSRTVFQPKWTP